MHRFLLLIAGLLAWVPPAPSSERQLDARELCREQVSGHYLSFLNDLDLLKGNLTQAREAGLAFKAKLRSLRREIASLQGRLEQQHIPAAELDEELIGLRDQADGFELQEKETAALVVELQASIATKERQFLDFKELMRPVFTLGNAKIALPGAYPLRLDYRHPCPRFQQLCPLPREQAQALRTLAPVLAEATSCLNYANMNTGPRSP